MINIIDNIYFNTSSLKIMQAVFAADALPDSDGPQLGGTSVFDSVLQILGLLVLFIIIILASYFATKWLGKMSAGSISNRNISIVETFKISPTKYVQIVRVADKHFAIGVSKDNITLLGEIDSDKIIAVENDFDMKNFKAFLDSAISKHKKNK